MIKRFLLAATVLLVLPGFSYAQQVVNLRSLAIDQMYLYGETIFQRGDYSEAAKVFTRILEMSPNNKGALGYAKALNKKGEHISIPERYAGIESASELRAVVRADLTDPNSDLKQDIRETDEGIQQLKNDISNLHQQLATKPQ